MTHDTSRHLAALYQQAIQWTTTAVDLAISGDEQGTHALLQRRASLLRSIQREFAEAPPWGIDTQIDTAALRYIHADGKLAQLLECLSQ